MRKRSLMGFFFFLAFDIGGAGIPKTSHGVFLCLFFFWLQMGTGMRPGGQASGFGCIRVGHERKERESGVF